MLKKISYYWKEKKFILILIVSIVFFVVSMIPIIYCSFFNYATGDDLNLSNITHQVIVNHGSVYDFLTGIWAKARSFYLGWGGNWAASILWTIQPSIWGEKVYHITLYISLFWMCLGIIYLTYHWYKKYLNANGIYYACVIIMLLTIAIQLMPKGGTAFFWYAVVVNYILPFGLALMSIVWIEKYIVDHKTMYLLYLTLAYIYIGGSGYMMIVMSFDIIILTILYIMYRKNNKNKSYSLWLLIPFVFFFLSVAFNVTAPGNSVRSGGVIDINILNIVKTIGLSIVKATAAVKDYFLEGKFLFVYILVLIYLSVCLVDVLHSKLDYKYIGLKIGIGYLIYCSTYAPMTLMNDIGGSSGHINSYWLVFIVWLTCSIIYLTCYFKSIVCNKGRGGNYNIVGYLYLGLIVWSMFFLKSYIKDFYAYDCYEYIKSGQLADYDAQMKERYVLLNDSEKEDIIVPFMNENQGPFIHFAIIEDPNCYTNCVNAEFYGKKSVIGMDRDIFYMQYGSRQ